MAVSDDQLDAIYNALRNIGKRLCQRECNHRSEKYGPDHTVDCHDLQHQLWVIKPDGPEFDD